MEPADYHQNEPLQYSTQNTANSEDRVEIMIIEYVDDEEDSGHLDKTGNACNLNLNPNELNTEAIASNTMLNISDDFQNGSIITSTSTMIPSVHNENQLTFIKNNGLVHVENMNLEGINNQEGIVYETVDNQYKSHNGDLHGLVQEDNNCIDVNGVRLDGTEYVDDNNGPTSGGDVALHEDEYLEEEYLTEAYEDELNCAESDGDIKPVLIQTTNNGSTLTNQMDVVHCSTDILHNLFHKCNECNSQFVSETFLKYHRYKNNHDLPFVCGVCGENFYELNDIISHEEKHHRRKSYLCLDCSQEFDQPHELVIHRKTHVKHISEFRCSLCDKVFESEELLTQHEHSPRIKRAQFKCSRCSATFFTQLGLSKHSKEHRFECATCGLKSPTMYYYKKHMTSHKKKASYTCNICQDVFVRNTDLMIHKKEHTSFEFKCMDCSKTFKKGHDLKKHRVTHFGNAYIPILPKPSSSSDFKLFWKS